MRNGTILAGLAGLTLLAACGGPEAILPGERMGLREVLTTEGAADPYRYAETENQSLPAALPAAQRNAQWAQSPVTQALRTTHADLSLPVAPLWSANIGDGDGRKVRLNVDPVTDGRAIYTMSSDFTVTATTPDGAQAWSHSVVPPRDGARQAQGGGLAVADGVLYVSSGFGVLTALDASSGAPIWRQELDATATGAPTVSGGLVYVTSGDNIAWAIETGNGRVRWQFDGAAGDVNNVAGAPAPALGGDRVIFSFGAGTMQSTFQQGGLSLWSADLAGRRTGRALSTVDDISGDPLIAGETVYAGSHSGRFAAFDLYSGERRWTVPMGAFDMPWAAGGSVYVVSDLHELVRIDAETGERIWAVELPGWVESRRPMRRRDRAYANHGPILVGGHLAVASSDGLIRFFRPSDGALAGSVEVPGGATTRPIVANGTLYVVSKRGRLHAFR
ncbi:PQQ-like beta-propeller repeat protein [Roseivivax sp. GX 12232]|uniref:PQQ-like beta-propeller repeat protein n=1 Tax=Roseivivax sp. GX 12232 TaxID=2900547 RepID=UPI001E5881BB|nr:PQQ-like beta-propeller repeat protein [Roseivivax sp. GX 12232]